MASDIPLTTRDAARLADVAVETIRYWERRGVLSAVRTPGGQRIFSEADVRKAAKYMRGRRRGRTAEAAE